MVSKACAKDLMRREVIVVRNDSTLKEVWDVFSTNRISGAPVVNEEGKLVGVISQHDLSRKFFGTGSVEPERSSFYYELPSLSDSFIPTGDNLRALFATRVAEVMNPYVITVSPSDSLGSVARAMRSHHIHRVIVAEGSKICGILTALDLLSLIEQQ